MKHCVLIFGLVLLLEAGVVSAQTANATMTGRVTDPTKALVVGARVTLISSGTNVRFEATTNRSGSYVITAIPPGNYRAEVEKAGFRTIVETGIVLHTQDAVELNYEMAVGASSESVTVSANSGMAPISESPAVGVLVNRDFVENMPLNGRSFQDLIALAPGAVPSADGSGRFNIDGQRNDSNYFTVDGIGANVAVQIDEGPGRALAGVYPAQTALGTTQSLVPVDDLQEFKVQTSGFSAEFGRQPGGQVELTTRSGSNKLHGSVFDFFRNEAFDANSWQANYFGKPKAPERQNDFGGTLGGPVKIPGFYNGTDRTFFFFSYEGLRLTLPKLDMETVPTVAFRESAAPTVQPFLNATPIPNGPANNDTGCSPLPSCTAVYTASIGNPSRLDSTNLRIDENVNQKLRFFGRYSYTPSRTATRSGSELDSTVTDSWLLTLGSTYQIHAHLIDEFRFNYSATTGSLTNASETFAGATPYPLNLLAPAPYDSTSTAVQFGVFFSLNNVNQFFVANTGKSTSDQHQLNVTDGLSWSLGNHNLKFGGDYRRLAPSYFIAAYGSGPNFYTLAAVQQGFVDQLFVSAGHQVRPVFTNTSLYAQDNWKLNRRFTLTYGLRWEFDPYPGPADGIYPLAVTEISDIATLQLAPRGAPAYRSTYRNFAPRAGFAYQVLPSESHGVVVRGGAGLFYDTGQALVGQSYSGYPFSATNVLNNAPLPLSSADEAAPSLNFPITPPYGFLGGVSDPHLKVPYTGQWNLSVDQHLGKQNQLTLSYVGNTGKKLLFTNYYFPSSNPNFANGIGITSNAAASSYNALQVLDSGYVVRGFEVLASYTWSHARDDSSSDNALSGLPPFWGNSDNDVRHVLATALNYQIPNPHRGGRLLGALGRSWLLANRLTAMSGLPTEVFQNFYFVSDGIGVPIRPDLVGGVPVYLHRVENVPGGWEVNSAAFRPVPTDPTTGAPLRQGNLGRNSIRLPGFWSLNTAIQRTFSVNETMKLDFRAEAFNVLNHPNFGAMDENLNDTTFGQLFPTAYTIGVRNRLYATGSARSLQLSLKVKF